ncbi:hypothetical protein [Granulicella arctica]|uniref:Uncharacterized protein n=1 Tax=Granulicella arctica TaxID=940613 RepID=A0A7Y9PIU3_9BACT|nr:hypothetical protein [Granulicella arctica]NYF80565.1 hypothetical protein [Granulicella arctica]
MSSEAESQYLTKGRAFVREAVSSLNLPDWENGRLYETTDEQIAVLDGRKSGRESRRDAANALHELANQRVIQSFGLPDDWKSILGTYLKAWVYGSNPHTLIDVGLLLTSAKEFEFAMRSYRVAELYVVEIEQSGSVLDKEWMVMGKLNETLQDLIAGLEKRPPPSA